MHHTLPPSWTVIRVSQLMSSLSLWFQMFTVFIIASNASDATPWARSVSCTVESFLSLLPPWPFSIRFEQRASFPLDQYIDNIYSQFCRNNGMWDVTDRDSGGKSYPCCKRTFWASKDYQIYFCGEEQSNCSCLDNDHIYPAQHNWYLSNAELEIYFCRLLYPHCGLRCVSHFFGERTRDAQWAYCVSAR